MTWQQILDFLVHYIRVHHLPVSYVNGHVIAYGIDITRWIPWAIAHPWDALQLLRSFGFPY